MQTVECIGAQGEGIARNAEDRKAGTYPREMDGVMLPTGTSPAIAAVNRLIQQVAPYDSTVLILGESGTGKEIAARAIHAASPRRQRPFVAVNCGAIPAELLESELFGHEKGSFTGAITSRKGRFEIAEGGTLFLDEIGDMSLPMQVKLLRVLQERIYERVGSNASSECDVRIIAATHRNLEESIVRGSFRGDLFYRLNVFPIEMPTLAARIDDLPALIDDFIAHAAGPRSAAPAAAAGDARRAGQLSVARQHPRTVESDRAPRHPVSRTSGGHRRSAGALSARRLDRAERRLPADHRRNSAAARLDGGRRGDRRRHRAAGRGVELRAGRRRRDCRRTASTCART